MPTPALKSPSKCGYSSVSAVRGLWFRVQGLGHSSVSAGREREKGGETGRERERKREREREREREKG
jgi:hypothetical protein